MPVINVLMTESLVLAKKPNRHFGFECIIKVYRCFTKKWVWFYGSDGQNRTHLMRIA